jgi:hypothetical protein
VNSEELVVRIFSEGWRAGGIEGRLLIEWLKGRMVYLNFVAKQ